MILFISRKLFSKKNLSNSLINMRRITIVGVTIAVATLILVVSTANGFKKMYKEAILEFNAHVVVMGLDGLSETNAALEKLNIFSCGDESECRKKPLFIKSNKSIVSKTPFIYEEALLAGKGGVRGVVIKGIDSKSFQKVNKMEMDLLYDDLGTSFSSEAMPVILGSALAENLNVKKGDVIRLFMPSSDEYKEAKVVGTFSSGLHDYDVRFILMSIDLVRDLYGYDEDASSGVEIKLNDPARSGYMAMQINKIMPEYGMPITWYELNRDLFAAVKLEAIMSAILVGTLVVAAALNIITVIVLFIIYRKNEIAILKTLGADLKKLKRIFMLGGLAIGLRGIVYGFAIGVFVGFVVTKFKLISLPSDIYFVSYLPIYISPIVCGIIIFFSFIICLIASFFAAQRASSVNLMDALKSGRD